jgi:hypothetical protein
MFLSLFQVDSRFRLLDSNELVGRFNDITREHPLFWITMAVLHFYELPEKLQLDTNRLCRFIGDIDPHALARSSQIN